MTEINPTPTDEEPTGYLLGNKTYDFLKNVVLVLLPALGVLYIALAAAWDLPKPQEVLATLAAIAVFLGVVVKIGDATYNRSDARYDGQVIVWPDGAGAPAGMANLQLNDETPAAIGAGQPELILKVVPPSKA